MNGCKGKKKTQPKTTEQTQNNAENLNETNPTKTDPCSAVEIVFVALERQESLVLC